MVPVTRDSLLAVTDAHIKSLGYEPQLMTVSFGTYNAQWRDYSKSVGLKAPKGIAGLKSRDYWAVYDGPWKHSPGGDVWVFVNRAEQ